MSYADIYVISYGPTPRFPLSVEFHLDKLEQMLKWYNHFSTVILIIVILIRTLYLHCINISVIQQDL